jgi:calcineurin-like phosphoesterase family protein
METFFISDTHFGHKNIITFDSLRPFRPFDTIEEHNAELVRRWNSVVRPKDIIWHLGDFCFGRRWLDIAGELNGSKRLVLGNHDTLQTADYLRFFHKVYGAVEFKGMILTHIPVHPQQLDRFRRNVHGHLHAEKLDDPRYINVSCEQIDLTPISIDELMARAAIREAA